MSEIILYTTEDGITKINVQLENETVWLTQKQMVELYQTAKSTVSEHIKNIYTDIRYKAYMLITIYLFYNK
jgi:hypothetical protein